MCCLFASTFFYFIYPLQYLVVILSAHAPFVFVCLCVFMCCGVCASSLCQLLPEVPFPPYPLPHHRASLHLTAPLQPASPVKHTLQAPSHPPVKTSLPEPSTNKNTPFLSAPFSRHLVGRLAEKRGSSRGRGGWGTDKGRVQWGAVACHILLIFSCIFLVSLSFSLGIQDRIVVGCFGQHQSLLLVI